jgi:hypothetical protein
MKAFIGLRRWRLVAVVVAGLATASGVAYATIPDGGGVYTACMLNKVGTIRLVDPSLGSSSLLGHCTALETQITWNQHGQKGDPGVPGLPGKDGVSPTVAELSTGDSHCPAGGAAMTDARGSTAYVCSGQNGKDGQPFAGTFTSPNGEFSLSVADDGVQIVGPDSKISLPSSGGVTVTSAGPVSVIGNQLHTVANDESISIHGNRSESVGGDASTAVGGNRVETIGKSDAVSVGGSRTESVGAAESIAVGGDRTQVISGDETVTIRGGRTETIDNSENVTIGASRSEKVGADESIRVGANRTEMVGGALGLQAAAAFSLDGSHVSINGGTTCQPAARIGDLVAYPALTILTGSPTVCIG